MKRTTLPSARSAARVVAEAWGEQTWITMLATSSGVASRYFRFGKIGGILWPNDRRSTFTITPVPAKLSAKPRATANCAVLVTL